MFVARTLKKKEPQAEINKDQHCHNYSELLKRKIRCNKKLIKFHCNFAVMHK